jgi:hypothetical protein
MACARSLMLVFSSLVFCLLSVALSQQMSRSASTSYSASATYRALPDDTSSAAGFSHAQVYYSSPRTAQHGFKLTGGPGSSNSDRHSQKSQQQQQKRKQGTEATSDKRRRLSTASSSTLDDFLPMPISKKRPARTFNDANGILPPQARSKSAQPLPVIANKPLASSPSVLSSKPSSVKHNALQSPPKGIKSQ